MKHFIFLILINLLIFPSCEVKKEDNSDSVQKVMDDVVTRLYSSMTPAQLDTIGNSYILKFISEKEKHELATKYMYFNVNVPVRVSLMRDMGQKIPPFWLEESGFNMTNLQVKNEHSVYEVWQKDFDAGKVELGINGFGQHRLFTLFL